MERGSPTTLRADSTDYHLHGRWHFATGTDMIAGKLQPEVQLVDVLGDLCLREVLIRAVDKERSLFSRETHVAGSLELPRYGALRRMTGVALNNRRATVL